MLLVISYIYYTDDTSPGVWLMASNGSEVYPNNTVISMIELFGPTLGYSLLCVTERRPCCFNSTGDWYYQNGTALPSYDQGFAFYTSRGDDGTVSLHTRDNNASSTNTSQFCCEILNKNDLSQKLCINICDPDCEMSEPMITTTVIKNRVPVQMTTVIHQILPTKQTKFDSAHIGATIGYHVTMGIAVLLCILMVAAAIVLWRYCSLKAKTTQKT